MSRSEDIDNGIWTDPDFRVLSPTASMVFLWSFTNQHNNMAGIYKIAVDTIAHETKVPEEDVLAALEELATAEMVFYEQNVLWVRARVKRQRSKGPKMAIGVANGLRTVPASHPLRVKFLEMYASHSWLTDALSEPYADTMENLSKNPVDKGDSDRFPIASVEATSPRPSPSPSPRPVSRATTDLEAKPQLAVDPHRSAVGELFAYWQTECRHATAKLSPERQSKLRARLNDGYTVEQIKSAIDGAAVGAFVDEHGKRHDDIELICRNGVKLESFIGRQPAREQGSTRERVINSQNAFLKHYPNKDAA